MIEGGEHTPLWLSHHWAHDFDRCIQVRGRMVCRRCAVLYPVGLLTAAALAIAGTDASSVPAWLLWLLPLPAVVEWTGEHLGWLRPSPRRLVVVTGLLAVACGGLYVRYLDDHTDAAFLGVFGVYGAWCIAVAVVGARRRRASGDRSEPSEVLGEVRRVGHDPGVVAGEAGDGEGR